MYTPGYPTKGQFTRKKNYEEVLSQFDMATLDLSDIFPTHIRAAFEALSRWFKGVFKTDLKGYNGNAENFHPVINMGPVQPPQRPNVKEAYLNMPKADWTKYNRSLMSWSVFARPEDFGITVEYFNPFFIIKKTNGNYRFVTVFAEVARNSKPQIALMANVDSTLREINQ